MPIDFIKKYATDKLHIQLTAIDPHGAGSIKTQTFLPDEYDTLCKDFVEKWNGTRNLYFTVNPLRSASNKKPTVSDIGMLRWLHVDIDPEDGENWEQSRADILQRLKAYAPAPTLIIDSGNGYQGFWKLQEPVPIKSTDHANDLAGYNIALRDDLQGDNVQDVCRIMRLPGTINIPNDRKIAKGRVARPSSVVYFENQIEYPLNTFRLVKGVSKAITPSKSDIDFTNLPAVSIGDLDVTATVKEAILTGKREKDASRSETVFFVGCALARAGIDRATIAAVLLNPDFGISESVRNQKTPWAYCLRQVDRCCDIAIHEELDELNQKYALVMDGGKVRVFHTYYCDVLKRETLQRIAVSDFKHMYDNRSVVVGKKKSGDPITMPLGTWWIKHPNRKTFKQIIFDPKGDDKPGCYNLWKGFNVEPSSGDWSLMKQHMLENLCSGDTEHYEYLLRWMAECIQKPGQPGQVAVVLRGDQGTGKGILARSFGRLWGQHFLHISHTRHLTGNFNAHLRDCIFLFADEAFWAGDKQGEGALKQLVTEPLLTIEAKGIDPVPAPNFVHLMMASNHEWVIPAGRMERRFFVLDVGSNRIQERGYFKKIADQLDAGGYEAMLYELQSMDLSDFDITRVPQTDALAEQKEISMEPHEAWLFSILQSGQALPEHGSWLEEVDSGRLYEEYLVMCDHIGVKRRKTQSHFGKFMAKVFPRMGRVRRSVKKRMRHTGDVIECRITAYTLPHLESARKYFEVYTGAKHKWDKTEVDSTVVDYGHLNGVGYDET